MSVHVPAGNRAVLTPSTRRARREHRLRRRRRGTAALTALALSAGTVVGALAPSATADEFTPQVSLEGVTPVVEGEEETRPEIIAGQDATYALRVGNPVAAGEEKFNTSVTALVPNGVSFVSATSPLGAPTATYGSGAELPDAAGGQPTVVDEGYQLWVWENVADLPAGAEIAPTFTVRPDADTFPVGSSDLDIQVTAYTSDDANLLPSFPGSSGVSTDPERLHTSRPGTSTETTPVMALRIHKSEPSPESELLRGVHDNHTTYTLRALYTGEGDTHPITVTDYLPAGLEYLGNGAIDHTGWDEYSGSGALVGDALTEGYLPEDSVETVELSDVEAQDLGLGEGAAGVYTRVTWTLPEERPDGTEQDWDASPGEPGEFVIRYRAAVPLFENTLDWDGDAPSADSGEQAANLNNNNGPSTRHGADSDDHTDATSYTNVATVSGEYQGDTADGESTQTDSSTEVIDAVDLRIVKSAAEGTFDTGELTTYTLDLATSEYTSAEDIVITDTIGNGMCPALPAQDGGEITFEVRTADGTDDYADAAAWSAVLPGETCGYPNEGDDRELTGATLTGLLFDETTGGYELTLAVAPMADGADHAVTYTVR